MSETITDLLSARADADVMDDMTDPDPEVLERARGPRRYSAAKYRARVLADYETLNKAGKGALLRREGLYASLITAWRKQRDGGALKALTMPTRSASSSSERAESDGAIGVISSLCT